MQELSAFQRDILFVVAGNESIHGLGIKEELQEYYEETEVNHGRLYPNLDELVDMGLITKGERDRRTNEYDITEQAEEMIKGRRGWENQYVEL